jgi:hypothetical protein
MSDAAQTLHLDASGDNFVLRKLSDDGSEQQMILTPDEVLTLAQSAPLFQERILAMRAPKAGTATAVLTTEVARIALALETLGENILMTLFAPSGGHVTFSLARALAKNLAQRLPEYVSELESHQMTKQ